MRAKVGLDSLVASKCAVARISADTSVFQATAPIRVYDQTVVRTQSKMLLQETPPDNFVVDINVALPLVVHQSIRQNAHPLLGFIAIGIPNVALNFFAM